ncbi:hypothetical protein FEZ51_09225 [Pediococcus stilesii]|uniref:Uncharacterized protein n=1 Tax=Pediococcus stilesii TaxID=331679 RepID=A0A5R9BRX0_9LACO|nr:MucBP domain-containing protein [Pediococcus stilesii]TLQ03468.1 hypothetical protein FEZ51_09225 [Pediococcus stilesii]
MSKNNLNGPLPLFIKSTVALSLATVGLISAPFFDTGMVNIDRFTNATEASAAEIPDLNDFYYDTSTARFASKSGKWNFLTGNQYESILASNIKVVDNVKTFSKSSAVVVLIKTSPAPTNGTFTLTDSSGVVQSGAIQSITLQGANYYAVSIPNATVQALLQRYATSGMTPQFKFTNVANIYGAYLPIEGFNDQATVSLPTVTVTQSDQKASAAIDGKQVTVKDSAGKTLTTLTLKSSWVSVTNDNNTAGNYSYTLNSTGLQAVKTALQSVAGGTHLKTVYTLTPPAAGKVIISGQKAGLTVNYVDQATGKTVKTDRSITGTVGSSGTYTVSIPDGYQLSTGQSSKINYQITADTSDDLTVKLTKKEPTSSSSRSSSSSSTTSKASSSKSSAPVMSASRRSSSAASQSSVPQSTPERRGIITVVLVDDDTNAPIDTKVYSDSVGRPLNLNLQALIQNLLRAGYAITRNELQSGSIVFSKTPSTYYVHFVKQASSPLENTINRALTPEQGNQNMKKPARTTPSTAAKSKKLGNAESLPGTSTLHQTLTSHAKHQRHGRQGSARTSSTPVIFDASMSNLLTTGGASGGGNGLGSDLDLSAFFVALVGTVNFGQH